jgi:hypothetical protein
MLSKDVCIKCIKSAENRDVPGAPGRYWRGWYAQEEEEWSRGRVYCRAGGLNALVYSTKDIPPEWCERKLEHAVSARLGEK